MSKESEDSLQISVLLFGACHLRTRAYQRLSFGRSGFDSAATVLGVAAGYHQQLPENTLSQRIRTKQMCLIQHILSSLAVRLLQEAA